MPSRPARAVADAPRRGREPQPPRHHLVLVQATVPPLDRSGVTAGIVGTVAFALGAVGCLLYPDWLAARGRAWWLWTAVTGVVVGVAFTLFCAWRDRRRRASAEQAVVDRDGVPDRGRRLGA